VVGFYGWVITVFYGAVLLDIAYAQRISAGFSPSEKNLAFSEISDLLLIFTFGVIVAALAAIGSAWDARIARYLFIVSLVILLLELFTPMVFPQFFREAQDLNFGPYLRLAINGSASICAFVGIYNYYKR
jgi:hypothetical protein